MKEVIIIPTYNEHDAIGPMLEQLRALYADADIVVVDDSSPDGTGAVVERYRSTDSHITLLTKETREGLGGAYLYALAYLEEHAEYEYLYTIDADGSHHAKDIARLRGALAHADVAVGSRYVQGGGVEHWHWSRRLLSSMGNAYVRFVLGTPVHDMTAGMIGIRKSALARINLSTIASSGYAYQIEFKYRALRAGLSLTEVPIVFTERRTGASKMHMGIVLEGLLVPWSLRIPGLSLQLMRFVVAGGSAALVHLVVLYLLTEWGKVWYVASSSAAFVVAFFVSFTLQKIWTFAERSVHQVPRQLALFLLIGLLNLLLNTALLYILVESVGLYYLLAQIVVTLIVALWSFVLYKRVVFRAR